MQEMAVKDVSPETEAVAASKNDFSQQLLNPLPEMTQARSAEHLFANAEARLDTETPTIISIDNDSVPASLLLPARLKRDTMRTRVKRLN